jgi:hypothetical protein
MKGMKVSRDEKTLRLSSIIFCGCRHKCTKVSRLVVVTACGACRGARASMDSPGISQKRGAKGESKDCWCSNKLGLARNTLPSTKRYVTRKERRDEMSLVVRLRSSGGSKPIRHPRLR